MYCIYVCMHVYSLYARIYTWCYRRCRKKERKTPEAMEKWKWELPQVGFEPTILCTPDRCFTNWATKVAQLAGSESNISYACMNRLTWHMYDCMYIYAFVYVHNLVWLRVLIQYVCNYAYISKYGYCKYTII